MDRHGGHRQYYLCAEVDARIAELEEALAEAVGRASEFLSHGTYYPQIQFDELQQWRAVLEKGKP